MNTLLHCQKFIPKIFLFEGLYKTAGSIGKETQFVSGYRQPKIVKAIISGIELGFSGNRTIDNPLYNRTSICIYLMY